MTSRKTTSHFPNYIQEEPSIKHQMLQDIRKIQGQSFFLSSLDSILQELTKGFVSQKQRERHTNSPESRSQVKD
ncbi:hypothetical protein EUGRSUZ_G03068 [Eucalyptus grandis]|uniref:Uncharacterized protein n=2 Tax=Eucalyptus grandis TaxID=71139 RepID=A0ACC3K9K0_EUCGR|nr:hypothetical protein EUGRSUZ_G03068 [Eucalyptus grandis]